MKQNPLTFLYFIIECPQRIDTGIGLQYRPVPDTYHTTPCAIMARATFMKPATLAPRT